MRHGMPARPFCRGVQVQGLQPLIGRSLEDLPPQYCELVSDFGHGGAGHADRTTRRIVGTNQQAGERQIPRVAGPSRKALDGYLLGGGPACEVAREDGRSQSAFLDVRHESLGEGLESLKPIEQPRKELREEVLGR